MKKAKERLLPANRFQIHLVPLCGRLPKIESQKHFCIIHFTAADFAAQPTVHQCNQFLDEPIALTPRKEFAPS